MSNEQIEILKISNDIVAVSSKEWLKLYDLKTKNLLRTEKKQDICSINWHPTDPNILNIVFKSNKETLLQVVDLRTNDEIIWNPN